MSGWQDALRAKATTASRRAACHCPPDEAHSSGCPLGPSAVLAAAPGERSERLWAEHRALTLALERAPAVGVRLDIPTPPQGNRRGHTRATAGRVKAQRSLAAQLLRTRALAPTGGSLAVLLTREGPRTLDDDNLRTTLKAVRDGVADWLGRDDGSATVVWLYDQRRGADGLVVEVWQR